MEYKDILNLIKSINKSDLTEFKMKQGDFEIVIRTDKYIKPGTTVVSSPPQVVQTPPAAQPVAAVPQVQTTSAPNEAATTSQTDASAEKPKDESPAAQGLIEVKSPIVGTFYRAPSPDKGPYVKVGDQIEVGSVICIVEAMKLFNEIESEVSGKVVKVMVDDASPVEYDQVLFLVEPA